MESEIKNKKRSIIKDNSIMNFILMTITLFLIEIIFRIMNGFAIFDYATLRIFISVCLFSLIITFISNLFKRRWLRNTINLLFVFVYSLYTWLQVGFINYLGVYISFHTSSQFGAVKDYIFDYLNSFKWTYHLLFVPFVVLLILYIFLFRKKEYKRGKFKNKILTFIPSLIALCGIYYGTLVLPFMQNSLQIKSNLKLFNNPDVPTVAVNQFGTTVFGILDLKSYLFPVAEEETVFNPTYPNKNGVTKREVSDALDKLAESDNSSKYSALNKYFASRPVTDYNEYTGMFEGKNVIVILMESVNEAIINEKEFPNFYKLYSEGWTWENNYSPRNSCATGNNEFSAMTSLFSIYNACTSNVYKDNTYFEGIFNLFNNKGYTTTGMHDFVEWYYKRKTIHPNMGAQSYYGADTLGIKTASYYGEWPSDIEFFDKAMDIILNDNSDKPFMTWFTTVTSHQPYTNDSTYGNLHKDYFMSLGYSSAVSRYLSKLKVVDDAIGTLVDRLKSAGVYDDTVIVLMADHYPYGLSKSQVAEMINHDLSDYEIEKTPLVIYNSSMTPKTFTEYNFYLNLVPTLANLMNLDYDPRLYLGHDVLSKDYESMVVFADGSWKNENAYYNASTSKITFYEENAYTPEEILAINNEVDAKITMSSRAIKNNYFNYLNEELKKYEDSSEEVQETEEPEDNTTE